MEYEQNPSVMERLLGVIKSQIKTKQTRSTLAKMTTRNRAGLPRTHASGPFVPSRKEPLSLREMGEINTFITINAVTTSSYTTSRLQFSRHVVRKVCSY